MICLYLKIPVNFVCLLLLDGFWIVHIPLVLMVKFQFFAWFPDHSPSCRIKFSRTDPGLCIYHWFIWLIYLFNSNKTFSHQRLLISSYVSLSDKSSQVFSLISIIAVVWMFSTRLLISESSSPCINSLVTGQIEPITIGIIGTYTTITTIIVNNANIKK